MRVRDLEKAAASATYAPPQRDGIAWSEGGLRCTFSRHNGVGYVTVLVPDLGTVWTEVAHDERHARGLARGAVPALVKGKAPPAGVFRRLEGMVAMAKAVPVSRDVREGVGDVSRGLFYVRLRKARPGEIRYQGRKPPGEGWVQYQSTRTGKSGWKYTPGGSGGAAEVKPPPKQRTPRVAAGGAAPRPPRAGAPQPVGAMRTRGAGGAGSGAPAGGGGATPRKSPVTITGARVTTGKGTTEVKAPAAGSSPTAPMKGKGKGKGKGAGKAAATPKGKAGAGTKGKAGAGAEAEVDPAYAPHESGKAWTDLADYHAGEAAGATDVHARGHHEAMSYAANLREMAGKAHAKGDTQIAERALGLSQKAQTLAGLHRARREASTDEERSTLDTQIREGTIDLDNRADEFALPRQERAADAGAGDGGEGADALPLTPKKGKGKGAKGETQAQRTEREFRESEARRYAPTHEQSGRSWDDLSRHHLSEVQIKMIDANGQVRPAQEIHHEQAYHQALGYAAELRALAADEHRRDTEREAAAPAGPKPKGGRFGGPSKEDRGKMASLKSRARNLSESLEYLARSHWDMVNARDEKTRMRAQRGIAQVHDNLREWSTDVDLRRGLEPVLDMMGFGPPKASDVARQPGFGTSMTKGARTVRPPSAVAAAARRGLALREKQSPSNRGGTAVGLKRAADLAARRPVSRDVLERMVSFFARHAVDKRAPGWRKGEEGYPSKGKQAWLLWGGDAGRAWAKAELRRMDREGGRAERKAERDAERAEETP